MLPKTHVAASRRGASPRLIGLVALVGFSSGILTGFLYQQHQKIGVGLAQWDDAHPASRQGFDSGPSESSGGAQGELSEHGFEIVRHDFSGSGAGGDGGAPHATPVITIGGASPAAGGPARTSRYSNSNKTGLTRDDMKRISGALDAAARAHKGDTIHTLFTSNGSPYQNIQGRIMYASYKLAQQMPGGEKMTGFTRILHRTTDDPVVGEIPTFRAYPLQPSCDTWCEFPVKDRANAVVQWLMAAEKDPSMIQGAWLLMLESDYVWRKPLQAPGDAFGPAVMGLGFEYDYINPAYPTVAPAIKEMCPTCIPEKVPRSGPAPVLLRPREMAYAAPDWETYSAWIEGNERARTNLDWVREMYAWCVAVHINNASILHEPPPQSRLLAQPPHDLQPGNAAIYHYTWGSIFKEGDKEVWRFDKRDYTAEADALKVPSFALPPQPFQEGKWKLQDGLAVGAPLHETLTDMLTIMNKAVATLPNLLGARRRRGRARQRRRLSAVDDGSGGGESGGGGSGGGGLGWLA